MASQEEQEMKEQMASFGLDMDAGEEDGASAAYAHPPMQHSPRESSHPSREYAHSAATQYRLNTEIERREQARRVSEQNQRESELNETERRLRQDRSENY